MHAVSRSLNKICLSVSSSLIPVIHFILFSDRSRPPPMITHFLTINLIDPEQVKFRTANALRLPCGASGENLVKWTWKHNDTEIPESELKFGKFRLSNDGNLTGSYLGSDDSGHYQCFVKDTVSGIVTFSRKIKVAVTGGIWGSLSSCYGYGNKNVP